MGQSSQEFALAEKIGARMKEIRRQKQITLIELSEKTAVAQATLSRMENGQMLGTVESHRKIAETLGISLSYLYEGIDERSQKVYRQKGETRKVLVKRDDFKSELLTSTDLSTKKLVPVLMTLNGNAKTSRDNGENGVDKFVWMIEGTVKLVFKSAEYELKTGDSIYFDASVSHHFENITSHAAKILMVSSSS